MKDSRYYEFLVDRLAPDAFLECLRSLRFAKELPVLFAFKHYQMCGDHIANGWDVLQPQAEYERLGLLQASVSPPASWRLTRVNAQFGLCPTYPQLLVVPQAIEYVLRFLI